MDQGILESLKRRYEKRPLHHLIIANEASSLPIPAILKRLTIKQAVYWSAQAWEETNEITLNRGWNKLLLPDHTGSAPESNSNSSTTASAETSESFATITPTPDRDNLEDFDALFQDLGYMSGNQDWLTPAEWLAQDISDPSFQLLSDDEIIASINQENSEHAEDESDESITTAVTHAQAYTAFETALEWLQSQGDTYPAHLLLVQKWKNSVAMKRMETKKQTKLSSYFINTVHN